MLYTYSNKFDVQTSGSLKIWKKRNKYQYAYFILNNYLIYIKYCCKKFTFLTIVSRAFLGKFKDTNVYHLVTPTT